MKKRLFPVVGIAAGLMLAFGSTLWSAGSASADPGDGLLGGLLGGGSGGLLGGDDGLLGDNGLISIDLLDEDNEDNALINVDLLNETEDGGTQIIGVDIVNDVTGDETLGLDVSIDTTNADGETHLVDVEVETELIDTPDGPGHRLGDHRDRLGRRR